MHNFWYFCTYLLYKFNNLYSNILFDIRNIPKNVPKNSVDDSKYKRVLLITCKVTNIFKEDRDGTLAWNGLIAASNHLWH